MVFLVLLSAYHQTKRFYIMKKLFKIIGSIILILIIAVVVFLYFVSTPLDNKEQKAEALTDKIQAAINQTA
jgi:H+/gluconate symporter-like permease